MLPNKNHTKSSRGCITGGFQRISLWNVTVRILFLTSVSDGDRVAVIEKDDGALLVHTMFSGNASNEHRHGAVGNQLANQLVSRC